MNITDTPKEGDLRVWHAWNFPDHMNRFRVPSVDEAKSMINQLAEADLARAEVYANAFGLEVYEDGDWSEWYNDDGMSITDLLDAEEAEASQ